MLIKLNQNSKTVLSHTQHHRKINASRQFTAKRLIFRTISHSKHRNTNLRIRCCKNSEEIPEKTRRRNVLVTPALSIGSYILRSIVVKSAEEKGVVAATALPATPSVEVVKEKTKKELDVIISRVYDAAAIGEPLAVGKDKSRVWEKLMNARIVYLGEAEQVPVGDDKEVELEIVKSLRNKCLEGERPISLALEAFPLDLQQQLNQYMDKRASFYPREYDGAYLQMRLSYSPAARLFLFVVQWIDFNLAGALGLLRILIYKTYVDGKTTMCIQERTASIKEFYAVIFPSLLQLERGITDADDQKQKEICATKYKKKVEMDASKMSEIDLERERECGICMEMNFKVVLPNCNHSLCMNCYRDWHTRSKSCPFCRDSLKRVDSADLWIYTDNSEIIDTASICKENLKRLFMYVDKLPSTLPDPRVCISTYDSSRRLK